MRKIIILSIILLILISCRPPSVDPPETSVIIAVTLLYQHKDTTMPCNAGPPNYTLCPKNGPSIGLFTADEDMMVIPSRTQRLKVCLAFL